MSPSRALSAAVVRLLRPLARILLRYGMPCGAFTELARWVYVDVAASEFGIPGRKQSNSRISVLTGLSRKEVLRLKTLTKRDDDETLQRYNRSARIITAWAREEGFTDEHGNPRILPFEGAENSFSELIRLYSGDLTPRAVLDELARVGAVERTEGGGIRLLTRSYVPKAASGEIDKLGILGTDVAALISTIGHNLRPDGHEPLYQRKVSYDNVPTAATRELRGVAAKKAQALLEELDQLLAQCDRDVTPTTEGEGRKRVMWGVYYFEEDVSGQDEKR